MRSLFLVLAAVGLSGCGATPTSPPVVPTPPAAEPAPPPVPTDATPSTDPLVRGAKEVIRGQVHPAAKRCYQEGLRVDPRQLGRVVVQIHIAPDGDVDSSSSSRTTGYPTASRTASPPPPGGPTSSLPAGRAR
jgi:hypothetical protein